MRERTPSADDTPKRAPPAPPREADVAGNKATKGGATEFYLGISSTANCKKMVASTNNLEDHAVNHAASVSTEIRQQQQQTHACRSVPTAQDKRSRLSNVINNLRKKVPETKCELSTNKEDDRNSVERNLETLEKYVMTVLNGVIEEEKERESSHEKFTVTTKLNDNSINEEDSLKKEDNSKDCENRLESFVPVSNEGKKDNLIQKLCSKEENSIDDEKKFNNEEHRTLGGIIMDRLSEHQDLLQMEEKDLNKTCKELLDDLLNDVLQMVHHDGAKDSLKMENSEKDQKSENLPTSLHCSLPLEKVASVLQTCQTQEISPSSQIPIKTSTKPPSPTVRHLCLYCDRKFSSISLRQRHTERVHQFKGGRRSERNNRKPSLNCQYCSDKSVDNLDNLFQHMIGNHNDKYHACLQCITRYLSKEALTNHMNEIHNLDRTSSTQESVKETSKELVLSPREKIETKEKKIEEKSDFHENSSTIVNNIPLNKELLSNPASPEFDSSFYSSVSCNIRDNLLHHLDGKLQKNSTSSSNSSTLDVKSPTTTTLYESNQVQFPIDISLTAVTPVYNKDYSTEKLENSSEYAQKPRKNFKSHPRRVSFEKYNFPRKYDGKEQWKCSIKDLSKFDISTQLSLRKKQQLIKERDNLNRLNQITNFSNTKSDIIPTDIESNSSSSRIDKNSDDDNTKVEDSFENNQHIKKTTEIELTADSTIEFAHYLRLKKLDESGDNNGNGNNIHYAELTGEWSRPRIYICRACGAKYETLKEMEDHKIATHPNVWCSHYEFAGDQLELYKHLILPEKNQTTTKSNTVSLEKTCTKCSKNCTTLAEFHKHMLECGGDQTWLLGLFGNGKKKCKWRPFGSRSRRRRNRGMKRNIQNSQTPRVYIPKEKQPSGPRVRPSDHESIQKMLANLPPKRATRKVLQESAARSQGRLRNVQTKARSNLVDNSSTRLSRNKAALRNKLLKNAKSFQRKRCRNDNISAAIETVVNNYNAEKHSDEKMNKNIESQETNKSDATKNESNTRSTKVIKNIKVISKKKNIKSKQALIRRVQQSKIRVIKSRNTGEKIIDSKLDGVVQVSIRRSSKDEINKIDTDKSETETLSTRKKKTSNPVVSLNASIKAKAQLRTIDGKFARGSVKNSKTNQSSNESQIKKKISITAGRFLRSKLKVAQNLMKDAVKTSRRNSRLSTDKIITTEVESINEETIKKVSHDSTKILRTSSRNSSINRKEINNEKCIGIKNKLEEGKGKRLNKIAKKANELKEENIEQPENTTRGRPRKSLPGKITETKNITLRRHSSTIIKVNKEENINSETKNEDLENKKQKQEQLSPENSPKNLKKNLKLKKFNKKTKITSEKEKTISSPPVVGKKEKTNAMRKSPRNAEKNNTSINKESDKIEVDNESPKLTEISKSETESTTEKVEKEEEVTCEIKTTEVKEDEVKNKEITTDEIISKVPETSDLINFSLDHIHQESCNSNMDSGKENSLEISLNVAKLKVTRQKKTRNSRKERTSKRSLNNVIGILTEGVNIPIEAQESVVLTLQTSLEVNNTDNSFNNDSARSENNLTNDKPLEIANNLDSSIQNNSTSMEIKESKTNEKKEEEEQQQQPKVDETSPTTDIILDLSRRKPKGKGSFLERIVSKIAKKKDVLLESDAGFSLGNVNSDLKNVLNNIAPILSENISENSEKKNESNPECQTENENININLNDSIDDDKKEEKSTRKSKKRSLEINSPKKNKRKITTQVPEEEIEVEKELSFGDIMSLVHKSEVPIEDIPEEPMIPEEDKTNKNTEDSKDNDNHNEVSKQNTESPKKSKRKRNSENQDEINNSDLKKIVEPQKTTRKSTRNSQKQDEEIQNDEVDKLTKNGTRKLNSTNDSNLKNQFSEESDDSECVETMKKKQSDKEIDKDTDSEMFKVPNTFTSKRSSKRKSLLLNETLNNSDDLLSEDSSTSESTCEESPTKSIKRKYSKRKQTIDTPSESEDDMSTDSSLTKENETDESHIGKRQKLGRKAKQNISLVDEHILLPDDETLINDDESPKEEEANLTEKKRPGRKPKNQNLIQPSIETSKITGDQIISEIIPTIQVEKKRPGRKPKKIFKESIQSEKIIEVNNDKNEIFEKPEEKLSEEIETSFEKTETLQISERKRPGRKPKKNLLDENPQLSNDEIPMQIEIPEENELLKIEEKKRPGRKLKKESNNSSITDISNISEENKINDDILIDQEVKSDLETKDDSKLTDNTEVEINSSIPEESLENQIEKKRPGRKAKKIVSEDETSLLIRQNETTKNVNEEINEQLNISKESTIVQIDETKLEKKKPGRKSKKNISLSEDDQESSTIINNKNQETEQLEKEDKSLDSNLTKSIEKKRPGRKPKLKIPIDDISMDTSSSSEVVEKINDQITEKMDNSEIIDQINFDKKRPKRKSKIISTEELNSKDDSVIIKDDTLVSNSSIQEDKKINIEINNSKEDHEFESTERKKLERKAKKNISLIDEHLNLSDDVFPEIEKEINPINFIETEKVETKIIENDVPLERKRPGRKSKKNISLIDEHLDLSDDLPLQNEDQNLNINPIEINTNEELKKFEPIVSLEKKRPGRKPKKTVIELNSEQNNLISTDVDQVLEEKEEISKSIIENEEKEKKKPGRKSKKSSLPEDTITNDKIELQENKIENPLDNTSQQDEFTERKRPGRKSKKYISLCEEHLALPDDEEIDLSEICKIDEIISDKEQNVTEEKIENTTDQSVERKHFGRKAKKSISLIDEHLELPGDNPINNSTIDSINDINEITEEILDESKNESLEKKRNASSDRKQKTPKKKLSNLFYDESIHQKDDSNEVKENKNEIINSKLEVISSTLDNITSILEKEVCQKTSTNEVLQFPSEILKENDKIEITEQNIFEKELSNSKEQEISLEPNSNQDPQESKEAIDDFQTPKKRPIGNFAVVHTKTGEILIVEKKKKLTKEAAKFFCDICATSFTRRSSLKKHNLSQSHLIQIQHSDKDQDKEISSVIEEKNLDNLDKTEKMDLQNENPADNLDVLNQLLDQHFKEKDSQEKQQQPQIPIIIPFVEKPLPIEQEQENMDDDLLDEEICKITENMTHDEYVLTDHISPVFPEAASTPIKNLSSKIESSETKEKITKKEKKKRNLAEEHLDLDTPDPILDVDSQSSMEKSSINENSNLILDNSTTEILISKILEIPNKTNETENILVTPKEKRKRKENSSHDEESLESESSMKRGSLRSTKNQEKEISRPKRNQNKQNYKEYECYDFDQDDLEIEISTTKRETLKSRKNTSTLNLSKSKKNQDLIEKLEKKQDNKNTNFSIDSLTQNCEIETISPEINSKIQNSNSKTESLFDEEESSKLNFLNLTETLKVQTDQINCNTNNSINTEFDSDDNSLNTDMSVDIQKLLDDPELSMDNNSLQPYIQTEFTNNISQKVIELNSEQESLPLIINIENKIQNKSPNDKIENNQNEKIEESKIEVENNKIEEKESKIENENKKEEEETISKSEKTTPKGQKGKSKQKKGSIKNKKSNLNHNEFSDNEDALESQSKNKIVRSVFGRVFAGEKVDKVREVLDDWNSKSESSDNELNRSKDVDSPKSRRESKKKESNKKNSKHRSRTSSTSTSTSGKSSQKRKNENEQETFTSKKQNSRNSSQEDIQLKTNRVENSLGTSELLITSSRCRQSKKKAEERISTISKAFEDESSIPDDDLIIKSQKLSKNKETSNEFKMKNISENNFYSESDYKEEEIPKKVKKTNDEEIDNKYDYLKKNEEFNLQESSSQNIEQLNPKSPSNISQLTQNSEDDDEDELEDVLLRRRMSPFFDYNNSYTSLGSSTNDETSDEEQKNYQEKEEKNPLRRKSCSSEFSGEKIVIRSPITNHEMRAEVVTIAPTDAIEDNALDVPQEIISATAAVTQHKSRQGKVLNFDEELFVECCSRLKATTEKELRGAKKIKLDHTENYRKEIPIQFFAPSKDRWRDAESQNSLGSLLESVNQLLGEEMYGNNDKDNRGHDKQSERSSRSASPDASRPDNLGYEDSLDVAFEHNNKLRDKIQQRMRESENLISNAFGQKSNNSGDYQINQFIPRENREEIEYNYERMQNQFNSPNLNTNGIYSNQSLHGGLLDKALSNLLHNNDKHDHNGSTPMTVLAELACARAPSSTQDSMKLTSEKKESIANITNFKDFTINKKSKNPIKELFERKKELYERKQIEKANVITKTNLQKGKKSKKSKKRQEFPLIRNDQYDGLAEKKKRRDIFEKKDDLNSSKTKDVYDFEDEESQMESGFSSVLSYRKTETNFKDLNSLISKSSSLENDSNFSKRLESIIDNKLKNSEKFAPKTKGALKAFQSEDKLITGPMDDFVERKKNSKRSIEQINKHSKQKKKNKQTKRKSRNAWYENDSSDEFITAAKTEDVGVGISKSQRTCSKGKQNLFAELSTSSESESIQNDNDEELIIQKQNEKIEQNYQDSLNIEESKKSFDDIDNDTYNWDEKNNLSTTDSESESELIIDLKKDSEENKEEISDEDEKDDKIIENSEQSKKEWIPLEEALNLLEKNDNLDGITKEMKIFAKASRTKAIRSESESSNNKFNKESKENHIPQDEQETQNDDLSVLPEKLTTNEKPEKESGNLPLHVFLSRKVQESKKRKQLQRKNKKLQQSSMTNFEPIRRQRKCAIGKQGLLAEISSSDDDEDFTKISHRRSKEKSENEKSRKPKKESKEKRKERYIEKKHEQMIAKEQKAIEEEILRELGKNKEEMKNSDNEQLENEQENNEKQNKKKHQNKKNSQTDEIGENESCDSESERKLSKTNQKCKKNIKKNKSRRNSMSSSKDSKERRLSSSKRDSDDEELRTTKSWNKVDDDVGVAIGRRKRAAANQLYYWSSSSDEDEMIETAPVAEEENDRLEQHGWIVGDSHKKMITMLAMEKQLKEKRRRSEDEFESGKGKSKKHRNSTS